MGNVETYRRAHEAFNARDWTAVVQDFAEDATFVDQARAVTLKGPGEFVDYLKDAWVGAFSDAQVTRAAYLDGGGSVVGQFVGTGTNDGQLGPLPATGKPMRVPFCEVMHFNAAGQIVAGELYYDQVSMLVQLGHMEPPPA